MHVLTAAVVVLALGVMVNLALTFALIRRLRLTGGGLMEAPPTFAQVGARVPPVSELTLAGSAWRSTDQPDIWLVAIMSTDCQPCRDLAQRLRRHPDLLGHDALLVVVGEHDGDNGAALELATYLDRPGQAVVLDPDHELLQVGGGITAYPTLLRVEDSRVEAASHRYQDVLGELEYARTRP